VPQGNGAWRHPRLPTVGLGPMKTIELRGGPCDGQRVAVPADTTKLQTPGPSAVGIGIYAPSRDRASDGVEIWDALELWNETSK
jgi:hypothetical protein